MLFLLAVAFLWPALLNGGPIWMPDTPSYLRAADSAAVKMFDVRTDWSIAYEALYEEGPASTALQPEAVPIDYSDPNPVTLKGRSIFYGAFLYASYQLGSLWLAIAVQALVVAAAVVATTRQIFSQFNRSLNGLEQLLVGVFLAIVSPVAFFSCYLMPDIFGGVAILAAIHLLVFWSQHGARQRFGWSLLLAFSLLAHNVNLFVIAAMVIVGLVASLACVWKPRSKATLTTIGAIALAVAGQATFSAAVNRLTGNPPVSPPFVAMRLIADGPGYDYLQGNCERQSFVYCRIVGKGPVHSDILLWSNQPDVALFRGLPDDLQRRSAKEERKFVFAVLVHSPGKVIVNSVRNGLAQLGSFSLRPFNYSASNKQRFSETLPPQLLAQVRESRAWSGKMPTRLFEGATILGFALSLILIARFAIWEKRWPLSPLHATIVLLLAALLVNSTITGALSGPKGRYQMRVVWVLPLVAVGIVLAQSGATPSRTSRQLRPGAPAA